LLAQASACASGFHFCFVITVAGSQEQNEQGEVSDGLFYSMFYLLFI